MWNIVILVLNLLNQITLHREVMFQSPAEEIFMSVSVVFPSVFLLLTGNPFSIAFLVFFLFPFFFPEVEVIQLLELLSKRELVCGPSILVSLLR